jgi:hypothetical protein
MPAAGAEVKPMSRSIQIRVFCLTAGTRAFPAVFAVPALLVACLSQPQVTALLDRPWWLPAALVMVAPLLPFAVLAVAWASLGRALRVGVTWAAVASSSATWWIARPDLAARSIHYYMTETALAAGPSARPELNPPPVSVFDEAAPAAAC